MNSVPAGRRRSLPSLLLGVLAMGSSFAIMGALVLSDVAAAELPEAPEPKLVAHVDQKEAVTPPATPTESAVLEEPMPIQEPVVKKRSKKSSKLDFGRFEGY
jgi:hypothetical protein